MSPCVAREASKLWRKVTVELSVEMQLLAEKWRLLLAGLVFQPLLVYRGIKFHQRKQESFHKTHRWTLKSIILKYIHGLAARGAHYLHRPGPILHDFGYAVLPELGKERGYISEIVFTFIFFSFILWSFHPFVFHSKRFYTVHLWCRVFAFLVASQILRIITFYSTQLPGPNYHCREGSELARLPYPQSIWEVLLINFPQGAIFGCGDLIFSSHMIFTLVFVHTFQKYGTKRFLKQLAWLMVVVQSLLIISSRKHYTVDVVVAWYTVNLVVFFVDKKLKEMPNRNVGAANSLLPVTAKEKDSKAKDETGKLLNGSSTDGVDRRQRNQANGKIIENGNIARAEKNTNGK